VRYALDINVLVVVRVEKSVVVAVETEVCVSVIVGGSDWVCVIVLSDVVVESWMVVNVVVV